VTPPGRGVGPWPAPCPIAPGATVGLGLDGTLASLVAAAWLTHGAHAWEDLGPPDARGAPGGTWPLASPSGWGGLVARAASLGQQWLVLPVVREDAHGVPWHAVAATCSHAGLALWAPFRMAPLLEVVRLGTWLGVPPDAGHACTSKPPCGTCGGCLRLAKVRAAVGGDPR
jgi:hypothetical protein